MYGESATATVDPYSDAYNAPPAPAPAEREPVSTRGRTRSRSPTRPSANGANGESRRYDRSPAYRSRRSPPRRASHSVVSPHELQNKAAKFNSTDKQNQQPNPSNVLGVFGLSIRTQERDLEDEFSRFGRVEKVTIVYDQRSDRSRGFGFIKMSAVEEATKCVQELNGIELNGRRIRVDYSVTDRPHAPTPGEYMGHRRSGRRDYDRRRDDRDSRRGDRDRDSGRDRSRDDNYGRDRDWRDRRSPPPKSGRLSPDYRRRRSVSKTPPRERSPPRGSNGRDYEAPAVNPPSQEAGRW